ncbi:pyridoxamine 5'-phosphate oxidase family protein [Streptomyces iconiensis]|uniref:pyridoxamine 5'-phosphate oxidase family protein n=1 Tax=Streptomyces iconiensis TaxID=1384038 RepID=UPI003D2F9A46
MTASTADGEGMAHGAGRPRPGSEGEHALQRRIGSSGRADRFYDEQVLDHLNERMREFTRQQEMFFLSTSDRNGECDSSFRAGPPGFLRVLDERTLVFPEYRGNGVHASLGNIQDNPHLGILLIDFVRARIGLHINGSAEVMEDADLRATVPDLPDDPVPGRRALLWVRVTVQEAYIHCAKHIPHLQKAPRRAARDWGTDDYKRKGGDFFGAARDARDARDAGDVSGGRDTRVAGGVRVAGAGPVTGAAWESGVAQEPGRTREAEAAREPVAAAWDVPEIMNVPKVRDVPENRNAPETRNVPETHEAVEVGASLSAREADEPSGARDASGARKPDGAREPGGARELTGGHAVPGQRRPHATHEVPGPREDPRPMAMPGHGNGSFTPAAPPSGAGTSPSAEPAQPTAPFAVSAAISARTESDTAGPVRDVSAWREQAERALAEARRRGAEHEPAPFQGWFG